ncbi:ADAM 10 precursor [Oncorhynchus mykiss]|uniref:ADAM 10 n=2 Tax=Oncorhynchus mykiss TaxID=8022 RepID=C1BFP1_ONCMY|nr:ADAM 10 precursor [Oncorhynchus mykiss]ACO07844.1 ADAM 10 precursor [Oncorhynchus mykiss]
MNLIDMVLIQLLLLFNCLWNIKGQYGNPLNKYIHHYEGLSYDTEALHSNHQRAKRAVSHEDKVLQLDFHAHGRHFNLRMKRDTSLFSPDLKVEVSGVEAPYDPSHIYTGEIFGSSPCLQQCSHVTQGKNRPRCVYPVM